MAVSNSPADQTRIEGLVGHPGHKFDLLKERVQVQVIKSFAAIETDFLDLIWTLDFYRTSQVVPRGMARPPKKGATSTPASQLEGIYRGKGNYFSTVTALILGNMTTSKLASRSNVMGFSQPHQIDIAWPDRDRKPLIDPLICCEAKLTGAPAYGTTPARGAYADWSNRRKEMKFQATDLKLYRNAQNTQIDNWDVWRVSAPPSVYSLWAARMRPDDQLKTMIEQARVLTETYSDGVGIYAFEVNELGTGYVASTLPKNVSARVTSLDNVLGKIAAQIRQIMRQNDDVVPPPVIAPAHAVSLGEDD